MRLSIGLPIDGSRDVDFLCSLALYAQDASVRRRTLAATLGSWSDFVAAVDSLDRDGLMSLARWVNFGEDQK